MNSRLNKLNLQQKKSCRFCMNADNTRIKHTNINITQFISCGYKEVVSAVNVNFPINCC